MTISSENLVSSSIVFLHSGVFPTALWEKGKTKRPRVGRWIFKDLLSNEFQLLIHFSNGLVLNIYKYLYYWRQLKPFILNNIILYIITGGICR